MTPHRRLVRFLAPSLLLVALAAPFAGRAFHVDEPLYLAAAGHLRGAPLDPLGAATFWHDRPATFFEDSYNPPLVLYLLAPVAGAGREVPVRFVILLLAAGALLAAAAAGRRLGVPESAHLPLAASPILVLCAVTATTDVPFLALSLVGWWLVLAGRTGRGGLALGLSALTRYAGALHAPLLLVAGRDRRTRLAALVVLLPLVAFGLWTVFRYGAAHPLVAGRLSDLTPGRLARSALAFVPALGLVGLPGVLPLLRLTRGLVLVAVAAGGLGAALLAREGGARASVVLGAAGFAAGAVLLAAAAGAARAAARSAPLALAAFVLFAAQAVLAVFFFAARYLLPLLPPLLWVLWCGGAVVTDAARLRRLLAVATSAALALALLVADGGAAEAWRRLAGRLPPGGRSFSVGHWGFQWYAEAAGWPPLAPRETLLPGDRVALAEGVHAPPLSPAHLARLVPAGGAQAASPALRTLDREAEAGLWSDAWGLLPLGWRPGAAERVALLAVADDLASRITDVSGPVLLDLGTPEAQTTLLDGWSTPESWVDGGARRDFVWSLGETGALRVWLPPGVDGLWLRAAPGAAAVGPLEVSVGEAAHARTTLQPGWYTYRMKIEGRVPPGETTLLLRPRAASLPGLFSRERRSLGVAVDWLALSDADAPRPPAGAAPGSEAGSLVPREGALADAGNRGVWPVLAPRRGLLVARADVRLELPAGRLKLRVLAGTARLATPAGLLWEGGLTPAAEAVTLEVPEGHVEIGAERALLEAFERRQP